MFPSIEQSQFPKQAIVAWLKSCGEGAAGGGNEQTTCFHAGGTFLEGN